jgi:hypothetical protein
MRPQPTQHQRPQRPPPVDNAALAEQRAVPNSVTLADLDALRARTLTATLRETLEVAETFRAHIAHLEANNAGLQEGLLRLSQEIAKLRAEIAAREEASVPTPAPAAEGGAA